MFRLNVIHSFTWFGNYLLQLLVQILLPLGESEQPLFPHSLQVHLLRTHARARTHGGRDTNSHQLYRTRSFDFTVHTIKTHYVVLQGIYLLDSCPCLHPHPEM